MGIFDFLKNKPEARKDRTIEDCVVKMFDSAGVKYNRSGNMFATEVVGKHCVFKTGIICEKGNSLLVCVNFPIPLEENVAFAANYEVRRIGKDAAEKFPGTDIILKEENGGYKILAVAKKKFDVLSDTAPEEIRNTMIHAVDVLDDKNFESLAAAILGYEDYEKVKENMHTESKGGNKVSIQLKDGYRGLLKETPNLSNSRYLGRLMAYAAWVIGAKGDDDKAKRANEALKDSFDGFIQEVYNVADEKERDLIRKLRFLGKAKGRDDDDDFALGKIEALFMTASGNPSSLLYDAEQNL